MFSSYIGVSGGILRDDEDKKKSPSGALTIHQLIVIFLGDSPHALVHSCRAPPGPGAMRDKGVLE